MLWICCKFVVQHVVQLIHNKSKTNRSSGLEFALEKLRFFEANLTKIVTRFLIEQNAVIMCASVMIK